MKYEVQKSIIKLGVLFLMYEMHHSMQIAVILLSRFILNTDVVHIQIETVQ